MAQGHRPDRVGEQIRDELSALLTRGTVHDPGIGFITLTRVKVSPDLQVARVFYTSLGDDKARRETAKALTRATPFLRRQIGSILRLRRVPELEFRFDESIEQQDRIEQILRDLHQEEAQRSHLGQGSGGQADEMADSSTPADAGSQSDPTSARSPVHSSGPATVDRPDDPDDN